MLAASFTAQDGALGGAGYLGHAVGSAPAAVAQEWVSEHLLKKAGDRDYQQRMSRQVAERLAMELRAKTQVIQHLQQQISDMGGGGAAGEFEGAPAALAEENERLKAKIEQMTQAVDYHQHQGPEEQAVLKDRIEDLTSKLAELRKSCAEKEEALSSQADSYKHLLEVAQRVANQNQVLNVEAERLGALVPSLKEECDAMKRCAGPDGVQALVDIIPKLTAELDAAREDANQVPALQAERSLLIQACEQMSDEIPALKARIEELQTKAAKAEGAVKLLRSDGQYVRQEYERLQGTVTTQAHREEEITRLLQAHAKLAEEVPGLIKLRDHLKHVLDEKVAHATSLEHELQRVTQHAQQAEASLKTQLLDLEALLQQQEVTCNDKIRQATELCQQRLAHLEAENAQIERALHKMHRKHVEEMQRLTSTFDIENTAVKQQAIEKEKQLAEVRRQLQDEAASRSEAGEREREVTVLQAVLQSNKALLQQKVDECEELRAEVERCRRDRGSGDEAERLRRVVGQQRDDIANLEMKLKLTLRGVQSCVGDRSHREKSLETEVQTLERQIADLIKLQQSLPPNPAQPAAGPPPLSPPVGRHAAAPYTHSPRNLSPPTSPPASRRSVSAVPPAANMDAPTVAPRRYHPPAVAPHEDEINVFRKYLALAGGSLLNSADLATAAAEAESLGRHAPGYWVEDSYRRTRVWMGQP